MTSSFRLFVELSIYCNVFHVLSKVLFQLQISCRNIKASILSKCRATLINQIVLSHVIICRKSHSVHQISWRRKRTYTNCPPAKTFRLLFWRNSHLLSISALMPCHLNFIKSKFDNPYFQCRFIITLSPQCHVQPTFTAYFHHFLTSWSLFNFHLFIIPIRNGHVSH